MVATTKVNLNRTKSADQENIHGLMASSMKAGGKMESNMVKVLSSVLKEYLGKENGNKESDSIGLTKLILTMGKAIGTQVSEGAV